MLKGKYYKIINGDKMKIQLLSAIILSVLISSCNTVEPPTPLPEYDSVDDSPAWSPDGNWIAYFHFNRNINDSLYPTGLYIIDTKGLNRKLLITGDVDLPDWSPDGKEIVFTNGNIFTIDINTRQINKITNKGSDFFPAYSPDGTNISFDRSGTADTVGTWIFNIVTHTQNRFGLFPQLDWSQDGNQIVYSGKSKNNNSESQIWLANSEGTNQQELTSNNFTYNRYPKWSNDSNKIAWEILINNTTYKEVWTMNSDGSSQTKLTDGSHPCWSSDNTRIAYSRLSVNKIVLFTIDIRTKIIKQLTF
jgi:Tol biopolymer transport system component